MFKPPVANCFDTDYSKVVTPRVLFFVICDVYFEIDLIKIYFKGGHFINHALLYPLFLGCVVRLCLLNVAIPDVHMSLFPTPVLVQINLLLCLTSPVFFLADVN
jgi:hypothetical protein